MDGVGVFVNDFDSFIMSEFGFHCYHRGLFQ